MYEKFILSKKDNTNIEIKTVITDANLLITAYSDLMLIKKHITETVYLESQIMRLKRENEELKQKNKEAWIDYQKLREDYKTLEKAFDNLIDYKIHANESLSETLERVTMMKCDLEKQLKHKNQLWKSAFRAYKNLKKKVETTLFPVEYMDFIDHACSELLGAKGDRVMYVFVMPWVKVKEYLNKKYKEGEK